MRSKVTGILINPTWEQSVQRDPLIAFSHYLAGRKNVLVVFAEEIIECLDRGFAQETVYCAHVERAESLMWFWILGAYEVVRTMCQAKTCFSERAMKELVQLKKTLSAVRMPAAKMEKLGERSPVTSNRSPSGWDDVNRDLFINDPDVNPPISARCILNEFDRVIASITKDDVLGRHEESYVD